MQQAETSPVAFILGESWLCVVSSFFRISRVPLQDSTMYLAAVILALCTLMKSINAN